MKKKLLTSVIIATVLVLSLGSLVYADSVIKLFLHGEELKTEVPPQIVEDNLLVPVHDLAEAFGAQVEWDEKTNSVLINGKEEDTTKQQVELLEEALAPKHPLAAAEAWAEGVKARNGAWQYAVFSPELRIEEYKRLVEANWSTGTLSSWVESYQVMERYRVDQEIYRFEVKFNYTDSTEKTFSTKEYVTVRKYEDAWLVSSIEQMEVKGEIKKVTSSEDETEKKVFVKAKAGESIGYGYDQANVIIGRKTKIYRGFTDQELTVDDLQKGTVVEVEFTNDPRIMIYPVSAQAETIRVLETDDSDVIVYENSQYGFVFALPQSWAGYEILMEEWQGQALDDGGEGKTVETGSLLKIRHPQWTSEEPRQDIPVLVFTLGQWDKMQEGEFHIGAAPMSPKELGRNSKYVFALPARYNYAFPTGYEEVEEILGKDSLKPLAE